MAVCEANRSTTNIGRHLGASTAPNGWTSAQIRSPPMPFLLHLLLVAEGTSGAQRSDQRRRESILMRLFYANWEHGFRALAAFCLAAFFLVVAFCGTTAHVQRVMGLALGSTARRRGKKRIIRNGGVYESGILRAGLEHTAEREHMMCAGRGRTVRLLVLVMAVAGMPSIALAADSWSISIGVRETGTSAAIGDDGGTSGGIEWVNLDGQSIIADGLWHQYTWNFGNDTVTAFTGSGNGVLSSSNMKGTLENIRILNSGGNTGGAINLRVDDIVNTVGGVPTTVAGFETSEGYIATGTGALTSSQAMFREPIFS